MSGPAFGAHIFRSTGFFSMLLLAGNVGAGIAAVTSQRHPAHAELRILLHPA